jgi:uncharacterized DUF497 family protein
VEIHELLFDRGNRRELAGHGIAPREVREIIDLDQWVVTRQPRYPDQVRVIGYTRGGRCLTVAMEPTHDPAIWRPVTGWAATREEVEYWREHHPQ